MAENMPNLCWMANADGWIHWYNRGWYDYTGTGPKDMEGWGWQSVHDPAALPEVMQNWTHSVAQGRPVRNDLPPARGRRRVPPVSHPRRPLP